jgi:pimeloyl-ACP methyl ester carboxylesterase
VLFKTRSTAAEYFKMGETSGYGLALVSASVAIVTWVAYQYIQPPRPKICGEPGGPPVTAPRVKLMDGRFLAYKEIGVSKEEAKYKIIAVHGYGGCRISMLGGLSEQLMKELKIYVVGFDRAGYGQSTPYPGRTLKTDAYDVQDLADALELGSTFYVAATSMGGAIGYSLMKYLPHRLEGIAMFAPATSFFWPGLPKDVATAAFYTQAIGDRMVLRVGHYAPWLLYWYFNQELFPTSSTVAMEKQQVKEVDRLRMSEHTAAAGDAMMEPTQQGKHESKYRDFRNCFGTWEFDPFKLENPFAKRKGSVHIWQGDDDYLVPVALQREVAKALPWIQYHEVPKAGHMLLGMPGMADKMIRILLEG